MKAVPTRAAALDLSSRICACGGPKSRHNTFCSHCYRRLTHAKRNSLYSRIGDGYEENYAAALEFLGLESPEMKRQELKANEESEASA